MLNFDKLIQWNVRGMFCLQKKQTCMIDCVNHKLSTLHMSRIRGVTSVGPRGAGTPL